MQARSLVRINAGFIRLILTVLFGVSVSACVTNVQQARNTGQTAGVVADASAGGLNYTEMTAQDHIAACNILLSARHYGALDTCIEVLETRAFENPAAFTAGLVDLTPAYYKSAIALLIAKRGLDLGDYPSAVAEARKVIAIGDSRVAYFQINSGISALQGLFSLGTQTPNDPNSEAQKRTRELIMSEAYGSMAVAYNALGDTASLETVRQALKDIYGQQLISDQNMAVDYVKRNLALSYFVSGNYETSYEWLLRDDRTGLMKFVDSTSGALDSVTKPLQEAFAFPILGASTDDVNFINTLPTKYQLCVTALETDRLVLAKTCFSDILNDRRSLAFGEYLFGSHYGMARLARQEGDLELAQTHLAEAITLIESQRASIVTERHKLGFVADKLDVYRDMIELLLQTGDQPAALEYVERAKSRALIDLLASRDGLAGTTAAVSVSPSRAERNRLLSTLEEIEAKERIGSMERTRSATLSAERQSVLQRLQQLEPKTIALVQVEKPDLAAIRAELADNETMLIFYGSGDSLYGFALDNRGVVAKQLNGDNVDILVTEFREQIMRASGTGYQRRGEQLYERLIAPFAQQIAGRSLVIVPHGKLHYLPFAALYDGQRHLIESRTVRVLPSASVLQYVDAQPVASPALLALGNPALSEPGLNLPGAEVETRTIVDGWGAAEAYLRGQATETAFKTEAGRYGYLHLASHGVFDSTLPLQSRLLLASDSANDGALTVREIYDLSLSADLVTLSACETALGDIANGDDVIGLNRGFFYAGARSIVSSLWVVSDESTEELMKAFYSHLKTSNKAQALRQAQLETAADYPHPFYWSAFQLSGAL